MAADVLAPCGARITAAMALNADLDGLVQDCSNSRVLAMELLQSCTKPTI